MLENSPEIPTVQEANQFPWASLAKFQWGLIAILISWTVFSKGRLSDEEREGYTRQIDQANLRTFKTQEESLEYFRRNGSLEKQVDVYKDSLNNIKKKVDGGLLPSAKQILEKNEK